MFTIQFQNPGLGEYKLRDMNDDINKMLRIKMAWEWRIKELGGPDYRYYFIVSKASKYTNNTF